MKRAVLVVLLLFLVACGSEDGRARRVTSTPIPGETAPASMRPTAMPTASPSRTAAAAAASSSPATAAPRRTSAPAPADLSKARVKLTRVATLSSPLALAVRRDDPALYVAEKGGRIRALRGGSPATVLDISGEVSTGSEQGLLGLAFSPDGRYLYVNFTNQSGDTRIREYGFTGGRASAPRDVLAVDQPYANHNGGHLAFGPDGYLYIGLGDGGSGGDPQNRAQNLDDLLGKMLRIVPRPSGNSAYGVPSGNPFVGRPGRDEIWAYGLRNPFRYSFDRASGDLWIGDVGQNAWEEVDLQPRSSDGGENYGWNRYEGTHRFTGAPLSNHEPPIYEYAHGGGNCTVIGGYRYRGSAIRHLSGAYVFGDYCVGRLRAFVPREGRATAHRFLGPQVDGLASFGEDAAGRLYVLSLSGGVHRLDPA